MTCSGVRRPARRLGAAALAAAVAAAPASAARVQEQDGGDRRYVIVGVDDSTVTFLAPRDRWLRAGAYGIAVDPRQRDALVGRLRVLRRAGDSSVALVTGQTTRLGPEHTAIFRRPSTPTLRQRAFWGGLLAGLTVGVAAAIGVVQLR